jgi:RHS repeat-associated protein
VYTQYLYTPLGKTSNMNGQSNVKTVLPAPGGAAIEYSGNNKIIYHKDWLGSARLLSNLVSRTSYFDVAYAPFGEPYATAGTSDIEFAGTMQDIVAGLNDTPAREQSATEGRWMSPDPISSGNRYVYAANNPVYYRDTTGLRPETPFYRSCDCVGGSAGEGSLSNGQAPDWYEAYRDHAALVAAQRATPVPPIPDVSDLPVTTRQLPSLEDKAQQVPTSLHVESQTDITRGVPSANYGIYIELKYQVLDKSGNPIKSDKMQPMENGVFGDGTKFSGPIVSQKPGENHTQPDGTFKDYPVGHLNPKPMSPVTIQQTISVVIDGKEYKVRTQTFKVTSDGYGRGRIANDVGDIDVTRP